MEGKGAQQIKKLIADFRLLATKFQKDNRIKSKNLKETNQVLEACKKEYQKLYRENATLKKFAEQQEELLKCQKELKNTNMSSVKPDRKIKLNDIEFDENKSKKLFAAPKKKRRYYDYYSDHNDNESADNVCEDSEVEESDEDEEIIIKKKKTLKKHN